MQTINDNENQDIPFLNNLMQRLATGKVISADLLINTDITSGLNIPAGTHFTGTINVIKYYNNYNIILYSGFGSPVIFQTGFGMGYSFYLKELRFSGSTISVVSANANLTDTLTYYYYE